MGMSAVGYKAPLRNNNGNSTTLTMAAKFSTERSGAATSRPMTLLAAAPSARAPTAATACIGPTGITSGTHKSSTPPCTIPIAVAAIIRPPRIAVTPAGLASINLSIPNSRS
jgi:hypothetical protein